MGCTPQLQLGWKAITIERNCGTPFSDKYISCCCLFISSLHRHQYLPGPITPLAVKLSGIILKSIYHFFGLDFLIMQWTGVLESTLDYAVCFIFSHSDKISKFPQLLGGNHGNSCFLGSTFFFSHLKLPRPVAGTRLCGWCTPWSAERVSCSGILGQDAEKTSRGVTPPKLQGMTANYCTFWIFWTDTCLAKESSKTGVWYSVRKSTRRQWKPLICNLLGFRTQGSAPHLCLLVYEPN